MSLFLLSMVFMPFFAWWTFSASLSTRNLGVLILDVEGLWPILDLMGRLGLAVIEGILTEACPIEVYLCLERVSERFHSLCLEAGDMVGIISTCLLSAHCLP